MVQPLFDEVSERLLAEDGALKRTRMMGSEGLKTGGKFFAMVSKGELVV
jgi:TfoX/Sxy family transcriptional regulator of competence genes